MFAVSVPSNVKGALLISHWKEGMNKEMKALKKNQKGSLTKIAEGKKVSYVLSYHQNPNPLFRSSYYSLCYLFVFKSDFPTLICSSKSNRKLMSATNSLVYLKQSSRAWFERISQAMVKYEYK